MTVSLNILTNCDTTSTLCMFMSMYAHTYDFMHTMHSCMYLYGQSLPSI